MPMIKTRKEKKQLELCLRYLSSVCVKSQYLSYYFTEYDFAFIRDRIIGRRFLKKVLQQWNIQDASGLKEKIKWLLEEGTRQEFKRTLHRLTPLAEKTREQYVEAHPDDKKLYIANYGLHILTDAGVAAFDYAWAIYLCRVGRSLNLLTKKEAQNYMFQAAQLAQQSYANWNDYLIAFHIGSHYHAADTEFTNYNKFNFIYSLTLVAHHKSPIHNKHGNDSAVSLFFSGNSAESSSVSAQKQA